MKFRFISCLSLLALSHGQTDCLGGVCDESEVRLNVDYRDRPHPLITTLNVGTTASSAKYRYLFVILIKSFCSTSICLLNIDHCQAEILMFTMMTARVV